MSMIMECPTPKVIPDSDPPQQWPGQTKDPLMINNKFQNKTDTKNS